MKDIKDYIIESVHINKKYDNQLNYVLDCIYVEDENGEDITDTLSDKEKVEYFFKQYKSEYTPDRRASEQENIRDFIQGLPSYFNIDYENSKIIEIGKSWGYCKNSKQEDNFVNGWFNAIAFRLIQLKRHFKIQ